MICCKTVVKTATILSVIFTALAILSRLLAFIASPIWLDAFLPNNYGYNGTNVSHPVSFRNSTSATRQTNPYFVVLMQGFVPFVFWSFALIFVKIFFPSQITEKEHNYPKWTFFVPGAFQAMSAVLINYSLSGTRTPPYLQAVLNNFTVPIQFLVRFIILCKRPTLRKVVCAATVVVAEFVCLIPSIFPGLENKAQHVEEGGATGAGRILFPLCFILSQVPYTVANTVMEKVVQDKDEDKQDKDDDAQDAGRSQHINMVYYMFWYYMALFLGVVSFFWIDIIPGIGYSPNIQEFGKRMWFNIQCMWGVGACAGVVSLLCWIIVLSNLLAVIAIAYLLRYSEGANYMIVTMALRSPLLLLFWALFQERPFHWNPQAHLSTYLSIGSLVIMVPAIVLYSTGPPEVNYKKTVVEERPPDERGLLENDHLNKNGMTSGTTNIQ